MYMRLFTAVLCTSGIMLSFYAYHVETSKEKDTNYTALCDIDEHMSCTAVFSSRYGKGFGLLANIFGDDSFLNQPNSVYGLIFYTAFFLLGEVQNIEAAKILIVIAVLSNICSIYLASILIFILHDFCVVCVTTYVINFFLLLSSYFRFKYHKVKIIETTKKLS